MIGDVNYRLPPAFITDSDGVGNKEEAEEEEEEGEEEEGEEEDYDCHFSLVWNVSMQYR